MDIQNLITALTKDNGAVKDLRDLLKITVFQVPALQNFFRTSYNAHNGDKVGYLGEMQNIGWTGADCKPEYKKASQSFAEKTWDIGAWSVPLYWCYKDFEDSIAEYALKTGTEIGNIIGTDIMDVVIEPALQDALTKMRWRIIWFGDKTAKDVNNSGNLTAGVDPDLFKVTDGFWKKLFAVGAGNTAQVTAIAANGESTRALQFSKLYDAGVATGIFDNILLNADSRIGGLNGNAIFCTESLRKALTHDMKQKYNHQLSWEQVESGIDGVELNGVRRAEYDGVTIYSLQIWDRMIQEFENNGTKLNKPHRAIFGSPEEMLVGTPANDIISDVEIWFNQDERQTKAYATGKIGTLIGQDELFQLAY